MSQPMDFDRRSFLAAASGSLAAMAVMPELGFARPAPVSADPIPVALIGAGRHGRALVDELQKLEACRVVAVCDTDPARLESIKRRVKDAATYATHAELLEKSKDVKAVIIATPTHLHKGPALDAMAAGKHVFCEAPLAHTAEDAREMARAAAKAATIFQSGLYARSNPVYKLARGFFRSDSVRDLICMHAQHFKKQTWRFPASDASREKEANWRLDPSVSLGLAGELGTHQFDVFHYYTSKYPKLVTGAGSIRLHNDGREVADTIDCALTFADGARLTYLATLGNSYEGRHEVFNGSNAAIKLSWSHGWLFKESDAPTQGWEVYANRQQFHNDEGITLIADATKLASQGKLKEGVGLPYSPQYYALSDFLASIVDGKPSVCTADEGVRATVVGIAANLAVRTGKPVEITEEMLKA